MPQFEETVVQIFRIQSQNCAVYRKFIEGLNINTERINTIYEIPFLPVEFFKSHRIVSADSQDDIVFTSSGTTGLITSTHHVMDVCWYTESFRRAFSLFYGDISKYTILALLPSYLERKGSSLIYMAEDLIAQSKNQASGFFLYNQEDLFKQLKKLQREQKPTILLGVTFALLEFAEKYTLTFPQLIVMETGGMKGRRKEMVREELHNILCRCFGVTLYTRNMG